MSKTVWVKRLARDSEPTIEVPKPRLPRLVSPPTMVPTFVTNVPYWKGRGVLSELNVVPASGPEMIRPPTAAVVILASLTTRLTGCPFPPVGQVAETATLLGQGFVIMALPALAKARSL